jgi:hypothetical protein
VQASDFFMLSAALGDLSNYARTKLKELGKLHGLFDDKAPLVPPPDPGAVDDSSASSSSSSSSSSAAEETANPGEQEAPPTVRHVPLHCVRTGVGRCDLPKKCRSSPQFNSHGAHSLE